MDDRMKMEFHKEKREHGTSIIEKIKLGVFPELMKNTTDTDTSLYQTK